ncbi:MAG TPA: hypothetical protein VKZ51_06330 [Cyclobacteriaceae bacterium]|nr:hypothetical protein [Cyclobacteriaceae bacterium]
MKKLCYVLLFTFVSVCTVQAQIENSPQHAFHIGYLAEMLTHPGLSLGYEKYLNDDSRFEVFFRATAGYYNHFRNNSTYMVTVESGFRRNLRGGLFLEQALGIGYFYRLVNSDGQYAVHDDGSIVEKPSLGNSFLPVLANVGIGYHFHTGKTRISPFLRPNFYWKMPFNDTPNMQMSLMAGIIYGIN